MKPFTPPSLAERKAARRELDALFGGPEAEAPARPAAKTRTAAPAGSRPTLHLNPRGRG